MQTSSELRYHNGSRVLHKGHYSFIFKGHRLGPNATSTLGQVIVDLILFQMSVQIRQQFFTLSTQTSSVFLLLIFFM